MMIGIIVKQISDKLEKFLDENNSKYNVTSDWVNNWLDDNKAPFRARIVGQDGKEIHGATVLIEKKGIS